MKISVDAQRIDVAKMGRQFLNGQQDPEHFPLSGVAGGLILRLKLGQGSALACATRMGCAVCLVPW